jgi:hypothetical protein
VNPIAEKVVEKLVELAKRAVKAAAIGAATYALTSIGNDAPAFGAEFDRPPSSSSRGTTSRASSRSNPSPSQGGAIPCIQT